MHTPSDFQQKVFNTLAILGLSQVQIYRDGGGAFTIETSAAWKRFLYTVLRINTLSKLLFLILLSCGFFQAEFEFFEKMAILLWFLIFILLTTSERLFYRKYPFFELLTAWWKVEESVFIRLGSPEKFLKDLRWISLWRVWFQGIIALVGILAVIVQYDAAPKYCVFAYSMITTEDELLKWVFGAHEVLFLAHAWLVYGSVIFISSVMGAEFTYNVESLREVMDMFVEHAYKTHYQNRAHQRQYSGFKRRRYSSSSSLLSAGSQPHRKHVLDMSMMLTQELQNVNETIQQIQYNPLTLINEYCHIYLVITQLNIFAAYNFLYMHACSYVQMVSDVFQMIQILRGPEADFLAVMFFAEDMMVCMYMLFRCFKSMGFLQPSSVTFLEKFRELLASPPSSSSPPPSRKYDFFMSRADRLLLTKLKPTLRVTAFKLGPCTVGPWTVGMAMDVLLQYYICVALWK